MAIVVEEIMMLLPKKFVRLEHLIGEEKVRDLANKCVLVAERGCM